MSLHALASGTLVGDPVHRSGTKGDYATATLRVTTDGGGLLVSVIAFGDGAEWLIGCGRGDAVSEWTARDGQLRRGLSIVAEQLETVRPRRRKGASRTQRPGPAYHAQRRDSHRAERPVDCVNDLLPADRAQ